MNAPDAPNSLPISRQLEKELGSEEKGWMLELARWYEADWAIAVKGGDPPSADLVLDMIEPSRREPLREVLSSIRDKYETEYEVNKSTHNGQMDATIDTSRRVPEVDESSTSSADEMTIDLIEPVHGIQSAVTKLPEEVEPDVTIDSTGVASHPDETIDHGTGLSRELSADNMDATFASDIPSAKGSATGSSGPVVRSGKSARSKQGRGDSQADKSKVHLPGYEIQTVLGRGGMGVVYLAQQSGIDRLVALKMILGGMHVDKQVLARFEAEARAIGKFQHENIVRIYDFGTHEEVPFFALEYIEGQDLAKRIGGEPMPVRESAELAKSIAEAMQYAHDGGVIHRDLKPGNVLLTKDNVPKVTDFGLAKEMEEDSGLSRTGAVVGTPAFMPPEQAEGLTEKIGPQSDVYAIGAILYCMLTGRPPFQSTKATDTLIQVITSEPVEPIALQPGIPKDLQTVCMKAMQKDLSKRYASAQELADDLGRYLRDEPIHARPVTRAERVVRWCRRNPKVAIPVATAATLAMAVLIGGPLSAAIIYQQKEQVVAEKQRADVNAAEAQKNAIVAEMNADEARKNAEEARKNAKKADENAAQARENAIVANDNAEAAQVQEKLAIDALKSMTFEVQKRMAGDTRLLGIRKNLLDTVGKGLQRMERQGKDTNAQNMIAAGIAVRKGDINLEIGRFAAASDDYENCLAIMESLHERSELTAPDHNLSKIHRLLALAYRERGKLELADQEFTKSLEIHRGWLPKEPEKVRPILAEVLTEFGSLSQERGDLAKSRKLLEEALDIRNELHQANPKGKGRFTGILDAKMALSKTVFQSGEQAEGLQLISEAADGMDRYLGWNPNSHVAVVKTALFKAVRGRFLLYQNKVDEAAEVFAESSSKIREVLEEHPTVLDYREALDRTLYPLGVAQQKQGKQEVASATLRESTELRREFYKIESDNAARRLNLAVALARLGEFDESIKLADQVRGSIDGDATILYHLGCVYAQLVGRQKSGDDQPDSELVNFAIKSLSSAIRAGFNRPTDLELDPDLSPIRELEPFAKLVSQTQKTQSEAK